MKKIDSLNQVAEFHRTFNAPILDTPQIPLDRAELRINLLQEELNELKEAIKNNDIVEVADAFADLQYVLSGAICNSQEEADATILHYQEKGQDAYSEKSGEKYNVHRKSDNKVLKSINYSPADLKSIIEK